MKIWRISPTPFKKRKTHKAMKTFLTYYNHGLLQKSRINHCLIQPQTSIKKMKNASVGQNTTLKHLRLFTKI